MKRLLLTLFCLLAPVALGATQLEATRANATAARAQVSGTRQAQLQSQAELNKLASRIEELKAQAKGKLLPGSELDSALKRSQELSASLTETASALSAQQNALEAANLALLAELSNELNRLRNDFDRQTDRNVRKNLIAKMRSLRSERDQVRAALPAAKLPALDTVRPSDDPEDLLEQADLLKDNEDKVRRQLQSLEKRIAEAKQERDLDNRVRQFLGDEALFDESDRRLRVTRTENTPPPPLGNDVPAAGVGGTRSPTPVPNAAQFEAGQSDSLGFAAPSSEAKSAADPGTTGVQPPTTGQFGNAPGAGSRLPQDSAGGSFGDSRQVPSSPKTVGGSDIRPNVGGTKAIGGNDEDDDLEDLEIQRAKLRGLADELKSRAAQLEKKAAQLK